MRTRLYSLDELNDIPGTTVFNALRLEFVVSGTDAAAAAQLVDGFKRR